MDTAQAHPAVLTREERANQRNAVLAGFLGWTLDAFDFFVLTFVIDDVARSFGRSRPDIALTLTLALAMRPVGALVFGMVADRFGRRLPLMLNVVFYAVISVLSGLAPTYQAFVILRLLFGIGMGGEWGIGASLALESTPARLRGLLSGLLQEGYAIGNLLAALAFRMVYVPVHAAYPDDGWRVLFFLGGLPALLSLFIRAKVKEPKAWHEHRLDWPTYRRSIFQHWRRFLYLVLLMTMMAFMSHGTQDMYPTFLQRQRLYSPTQTANITMMSMLGAVLGGLCFGYYSDRRGRRRAMITAALAGFCTIPLWIAAPNTLLIIVGAFLIQFFVQGAWGVIPAHLNELSPGHMRGFFPGLAYQFGAFFSASITYIEALLGEHFTYAQAMGILAAVIMLGVAVVTFAGPEAHGVSFRKAEA
jgi:SHS family lactate transporter-like MFS transporter